MRNSRAMNRIPPLLRWLLYLNLLLLLFMSVARLLTYMIFAAPGQEETELAATFWMGLRFDFRVVAGLSLVILVIGSFRKLNPFATPGSRKPWELILTIIMFVLVLLYIVDFLHFRYLNQRLNASALGFLQDAGISAEMVWQTYPVIRLSLAVLLTTWLLARGLKKLYALAATPSLPWRGGIVWAIVFGSIWAFGIFGRIGQYPLRWSDAFNLNSDFKANLALNPLQSFLSSFRYRSSGYDKEKVNAAYLDMARWLEVDKPDSSQLNFVRRVQPDSLANWQGTNVPNVVLVVCESFSGYKSSMWGSPLNTTPYFAQLCKNGLFFDNCFTPTVATARGVWATLTGIPDVELVKTSSRNPRMVDQHTIINNFTNHKKFYFIGGSTSWANIRGLLHNNIHGLKIFEEGDYKVPKVDVWGISDKNLFLEADKVLATQTDPFFAIIQTADNHRPYTIPEEDRLALGIVNHPLDTLRKYGFVSNEELNAFRYTDYCFKVFLEKAEQQPYFDNTLFVFVGDHGIAGDAGDLFPPVWTTNSLSAHHVPLLFYAPGKIPSKRIHDLASQLDVLPTTAGIANIPYVNTTLGRDIAAAHYAGRGDSNRTFILDINNKNRGILFGHYYYSNSLQGSIQSMDWADFSVHQNETPPAPVWYEWWSAAYFETARYLLLHNQKKNAAADR